MSQHLFKATNTQKHAMHVFCGYDRVLRHFFLTIGFDEEQYDEVQADELALTSTGETYESMYERGGGISRSQLYEALEQRGIAMPEGLLFELGAEFDADVRTNYCIHWPLTDPSDLLHLRIKMEMSQVEGTLANDEVSTDEELVEFLTPLTRNLLPADKVKELIEKERPQFLRYMFHEISWREYLPDFVPHLIGLLPKQEAA